MKFRPAVPLLFGLFGSACEAEHDALGPDVDLAPYDETMTLEYDAGIGFGPGSRSVHAFDLDRLGAYDFKLGNGAATHYVLVFERTEIPRGVETDLAEAGGTLVRAFSPIGVALAKSTNPDFAKRMRGIRGVQAVGAQRAFTLPMTMRDKRGGSARPPEPTPQDALYDLQWNIRRVGADRAWRTTTGSRDTVVAVIDTGIAANHPDFGDNLVDEQCYTLASLEGSEPCRTYPQWHWHGTHVAGIIAAQFGGGAVVGVGPGLGLASYSVFEMIELEIDEQPVFFVGAWEVSIWAAMIDAADKGYDVINMSLGRYIDFGDPSEEDLASWEAWKRTAEYVHEAGTVSVAAATNDSIDLDGPIAAVPAGVPRVLGVSATGIRPDPVYPAKRSHDVLTFFSNYGKSTIAFAAPGGDCGPGSNCVANLPSNWHLYLIMSSSVDLDGIVCIPGEGCRPPPCALARRCRVAYLHAAGTSMAAPHVAATAGLLRDVQPRLSPDQVRRRMRVHAQDIGPQRFFGAGMVDAAATVACRLMGPKGRCLRP